MSQTYTKGMGFIPPLPINLANMSTNVAASTLQPWNANTAYVLDAEVIDTTTRIIYRSLLAGNQGNNPLTTSGKWQARGVENRLRMFDTSMGSYTEAPELIEVAIQPRRVVTDIALFARAQQVRVIMTDPNDGLVFDSGDISMLRPSGNSHWGYFFTPIEFRDRVLITGLPAYTRAEVKVQLKSPGSVARCSELVMGRTVWLGNTRWRPSIGFDDFSEKKRDTWGGWVVSEQAYSDRMKLDVLVEGTAYERVREQIVPYRAKPVVWIGARGYAALMSYGYITGFEQVLPGHGFSDCSMTIEGLEISQ